MASLRDVVSEYQDDLRNGIAWLAFWREGRSWQAEAFHLDLDDTLYPEDRARLAEIQAADPRAIVVNGYYSGYLGEEMSVAELAAGVRHHYDNGLNNIAPFMEAHSDELPPDVLEAAREKAHAAGLPFYERPYRGDDIDPYSYDGHMSIEDYELMQKLIEQDRERSEPMSEVFSILLHIIKRLYEDNISGKLSDERFIKLSRDYELEQTNLTNLVEHLRQEVKEQEKQKVNVRQFIAAVRKYTDMQQLDASILREFVDKIYISEVYTPDENEPRIKVREIEIVYNFIGAFDFEDAREQSQAAQKEKKTGVA